MAVFVTLDEDEARSLAASCVNAARRLSGLGGCEADARNLAGFGLELTRLAEDSSEPVKLHAVG